jgi:hypothetical protein
VEFKTKIVLLNKKSTQNEGVIVFLKVSGRRA